MQNKLAILCQYRDLESRLWQLSDSSWEFLKIEKKDENSSKQFKTVLVDKNNVKQLIFE